MMMPPMDVERFFFCVRKEDIFTLTQVVLTLLFLSILYVIHGRHDIFGAISWSKISHVLRGIVRLNIFKTLQARVVFFVFHPSLPFSRFLDSYRKTLGRSSEGTWCRMVIWWIFRKLESFPFPTFDSSASLSSWLLFLTFRSYIIVSRMT